jgi:hypothetical protein
LKYFQKSIHEGQKRQFWIHRFDDRVIRNSKMLWAVINYIHNNPVDAELVERPEDYKYSSARNYINDDQSILYVEKSRAGIDLCKNRRGMVLDGG